MGLETWLEILDFLFSADETILVCPDDGGSSLEDLTAALLLELVDTVLVTRVVDTTVSSSSSQNFFFRRSRLPETAARAGPSEMDSERALPLICPGPGAGGCCCSAATEAEIFRSGRRLRFSLLFRLFLSDKADDATEPAEDTGVAAVVGAVGAAVAKLVVVTAASEESAALTLSSLLLLRNDLTLRTPRTVLTSNFRFLSRRIGRAHV